MGGTNSKPTNNNNNNNNRRKKKKVGKKRRVSGNESHDDYIHRLGGKDKDKDMRGENSEDLMKQLHARQRKLRK